MNVFCTVVSKSHLGNAIVLHKTLRRSGNNEILYVLVTDLIEDEVVEDFEFKVIYLKDLSNSLPSLMEYYYDAFEFCCALKPFFVKHLFDISTIDKVIYLDGDIYATGSFSRVWDELNTATLILTPHHITPPPFDINHINQLDIIKFGFINGGFYGWSRTVSLKPILNWMCERFSKFGFCNISKNMFVDQLLLPLVLGYFPNEVRVSHDEGLNIAYWNAHEREVKKINNTWKIKGKAVVFFHMSGYRITSKDKVCEYLSKQINESILNYADWFKCLMTEYLEFLNYNTNKYHTKNYKFTLYKNVKLDNKLRQLIFEKGNLNKSSFEFWLIVILGKIKAFILEIIKGFKLLKL